MLVTGFLQRALGLTTGNLSPHLSTLEAAGLVVSPRAFIGRQACARHWAQLEALRGLGR